jgi:predicted amino acid-binding ACT domain protein
MSDEHIEKTKSAVNAAGHIPADKKAALSAALSKLQPVIAKVSETHHEDAATIARLVEASTHEATRKKKRPELLKTLLHALKQSVEHFEASHPELVAVVIEYSALLAEMGI